jgi:hypothetical protein
MGGKSTFAPFFLELEIVSPLLALRLEIPISATSERAVSPNYRLMEISG